MLDTSNLGFGRVEKNLEAFEVERFIKKLVETQIFLSGSADEFSMIC